VGHYALATGRPYNARLSQCADRSGRADGTIRAVRAHTSSQKTEQEVRIVDCFADKTAIVTGAASGIGLALSAELGGRGAVVTMVDINAELLETSAQSLNAKGYRVNARPLDVTDFDRVSRLIGDTVAEHGHLDYIFNNAGVAVMGAAEDLSIQDWHKVIDVNLFGAINGSMAAYPVMIRQGSGHIVNTCSVAGLVPFPGEMPYTTSKHGILGLSNALSVEGRGYGLKASAVCSGFVRTAMSDNMELRNLDRRKAMQMAPKGISPEKCARIVLKGVERGKAIIVTDAFTWMLWSLNRLSPGLARTVLAGAMKKFRQSVIV
jgi:NAD(P)-dependent dehydrogenase (short-subunit alcohol dehydrogenase family)